MLLECNLAVTTAELLENTDSKQDKIRQLQVTTSLKRML